MAVRNLETRGARIKDAIRHPFSSEHRAERKVQRKGGFDSKAKAERNMKDIIDKHHSKEWEDTVQKIKAELIAKNGEKWMADNYRDTPEALKSARKEHKRALRGYASTTDEARNFLAGIDSSSELAAFKAGFDRDELKTKIEEAIYKGIKDQYDLEKNVGQANYNRIAATIDKDERQKKENEIRDLTPSGGMSNEYILIRERVISEKRNEIIREFEADEINRLSRKFESTHGCAPTGKDLSDIKQEASSQRSQNAWMLKGADNKLPEVLKDGALDAMIEAAIPKAARQYIDNLAGTEKIAYIDKIKAAVESEKNAKISAAALTPAELDRRASEWIDGKANEQKDVLAKEKIREIVNRDETVKAWLDEKLAKEMDGQMENIARSMAVTEYAIDKGEKQWADFQRPRKLVRSQLRYALFHPLRDRSTRRGEIKRINDMMAYWDNLFVKFRSIDIEDMMGVTRGETRLEAQRDLLKIIHDTSEKMKIYDEIIKRGPEGLMSGAGGKEGGPLAEMDALDDQGGDGPMRAGRGDNGEKGYGKDRVAYVRALNERNKLQAIKDRAQMKLDVLEKRIRIAGVVGDLKNGIMERVRTRIDQAMTFRSQLVNEKNAIKTRREQRRHNRATERNSRSNTRRAWLQTIWQMTRVSV
ncbi:MAG TPA: hypothetical protein VKR06_26010 [Ktedonosporobacter sp.]|nr:hypothetical protein [Ktedonosporobacter sp.]